MSHSPTGYWANYRTLVHEPCKPTATHPWPHKIVRSWHHCLPVVGYTDTALIIDEDGTVKTVGALLDELREGGDTPDEEGQTWAVSLEVTTHPAADEEEE